MIRPVTLEDAEAIANIYNYYVECTVITFEEELISVDEMRERIKTISASFPYIVYIENDEVVGYAYANTWRTRKAYRFSAESSIYVKHDCHSKGIGHQLYSNLIDSLRNLGFHMVVGGVTLPNEKSEKLHNRLGFTKVAHFKDAGWKFEQWLDVGFWELLL